MSLSQNPLLVEFFDKGCQSSQPLFSPAQTTASGAGGRARQDASVLSVPSQPLGGHLTSERVCGYGILRMASGLMASGHAFSFCLNPMTGAAPENLGRRCSLAYLCRSPSHGPVDLLTPCLASRALGLLQLSPSRPLGFCLRALAGSVGNPCSFVSLSASQAATRSAWSVCLPGILLSAAS